MYALSNAFKPGLFEDSFCSDIRCGKIWFLFSLLCVLYLCDLFYFLKKFIAYKQPGENEKKLCTNEVSSL